jgi:putative endonuclease
MAFFVYIVASKRNGRLYIGMTDDLLKRAWQHKESILPGFTRDYGVKKLVWYEVHETREAVLLRERQLKKWNRAWKLALIEKTNQNWYDLVEGLSV